MVDAVISFVVNKLGDLLIKEVAFLQGVRKEAEWLKDELRCMQRFLKYAEEKQYEDATIRGWVSDIGELAYDIEDLLDRLHLGVHDAAEDDQETTEREPKPAGTVEESPKPGCFPSLCSCIFDKSKGNANLYNIGKETAILYNKGKETAKLYMVGKEFEVFKSRINDLSGRRQRYELLDSSSRGEKRSKTLGKLKDIRRVTSFAVEKDVVGFEDDAEDLLSKLLDDEPERFIISIYGTGGLGKTTLAGTLYNNDKVRRRFNCRAWVSVSQDYTTRDLFQRIIKSFQFKTAVMAELETMDEADLGRYLQRSLQEPSYLVVMDDVWDKEAWASLKGAFPDNKNGSRVIITTRDKEVAEHLDGRTTYPHQLRFLRPDESWQLFCKKAFQNTDVDKELEEMGKKMVKKCGGLPLAIIVLGGLLSGRKPREWRLVHDHIWRQLKNKSIEISYLLTLSFNYLPHQLKQCFLYIGVFPEDFEIDIEDLIHLWVAEGFIPEDEDYIMEDVAKSYLVELVNRSLLQVDTRFWKKNATCRVHDLLRDLAIDKATNFNLLHIYDEDKHSNISSIISPCLRQAIFSKIRVLPWLEQCNPRLRSLFLFNRENHLEPAMCKKFRSLRVLNVGNVDQRTNIDREIGNLIHLKYLKLRKPNLDSYPLPIINLLRLQTLDVDGNVELPAEIGQLQELRHLIGKFSDGRLHIDNLEKLQTLKQVNINVWAQIKTERLVNLRDLRIHTDEHCGHELNFLDSISKLKSLRSLWINLPALSFTPLQPLSHCQHLVELVLMGVIRELPEDIHEILQNLERLCLCSSYIGQDSISRLGKLPNLMLLDLSHRSFRGRKLICSTNGFLRLETLQINQIEELEVPEGALPRLRGLKIPENCRLLIPETMRSRFQKMVAYY